MKRVRPFSGYKQPTVSEIDHYMKDMIEKKQSYSYDLITDIANYYSHLYFNSEEQILENLVDKDLSMEDYEYYNGVQKFISNLDFTQYPGNTPLQKSTNIIKLINSQNNKKNSKEKTTDGEYKIDILEKGSNLSKIINDINQNIRNLSEIQKNALEIQYDDNNVDISKLDSTIIKILELLGRLNKFDKFKTGQYYKREYTKDGQHTEYKKIDLISDLTKISSHNLVMPNFFYNLVKKNYTKPIRYDYIQEKQILFYLEDDSGSMSSKTKKAWTLAVLLNRGEAIAKHGAELIFYSYETERYNKHHLKTEQEFIDFFKVHKNKSPNKGTTDINTVLEETIDEIHINYKDMHPHIAIVCDGEDYVNTTLNNKGCVIHGIIIGTQNPQLKTVCLNSGGIFIEELLK